MYNLVLRQLDSLGFGKIAHASRVTVFRQPEENGWHKPDEYPDCVFSNLG